MMPAVKVKKRHSDYYAPSEEVSRAFQSLERAVLKRIQCKQRKKVSCVGCIIPSDLAMKKIQDCLDQMHYCLTGLVQKTKSLTTGLDCFQQLWSLHFLPRIERALSSTAKPSQVTSSQSTTTSKLDELTRILNHVFAFFVRLHDGLILIISGDCRHDSDVRRSSSSRFRSRLPLNTAVYSNNHHYDGASWDEWHDDQHGLQHRLVKLLRQYLSNRLDWDMLVESGGQGVETLLMQAEADRMEAQAAFLNMARTMERELRARLERHLESTATATVDAHDKRERIFIRVGNGRTIQLDRYGDKFQINEVCLPAYTTVEEWKQIMMLVDETAVGGCVGVQTKKKQRGVIDDSSSSSDEEIPPVKASGASHANMKKVATNKESWSGLVVKVHDDTPEKEPLESVNEIKRNCGVDVDEREQNQQLLHEEEAAASRAAAEIDNATEDLLTMELVENDVKAAAAELQRAMNDGYPDDYILIVTDHLRECTVIAGNTCLWAGDGDDEEYYDTGAPNDSKARAERMHRLRRAITHFENAQTTVMKQEALLEQICKKSTSSQDETQLVVDLPAERRTIKLLLGRARVNAGIARVHLIRHLFTKILRNEQIQRAHEDIKAAVYNADSMKQLALSDGRLDSASPILLQLHTIKDKLEAQELASLALRWEGVLLWEQGGRRLEAVRAFERAASVLNEVDGADYAFHRDLFDIALRVLVEGYNAWVTLADLVIKFLTNVAIKTLRTHATRHKELLTTLVTSLNNAASASRLIYELANNSSSLETDRNCHLEYLNEQGVLESDELLKTLDEMSTWWQEANERLHQTTDRPKDASELHRGDVAPLHPAPMMSARFVVGRTGQQTRIKKRSSSRHHSAHAHEPTTVVKTNAKHQEQRYLKWGDDLLPQTVDEQGRSVPLLSYPAIAPEMPPAIRAALDSRQRQLELLET
jgi:hypothetical protein